MNTQTTTPPRTDHWASAAAAVLSLLLVRPYLAATPLDGTFVLGGIYVALLVVSTVGPVPHSDRRLHAAPVLLLGCGAVWLSQSASGPAIPSVAGLAATPLALNMLAAVAEEAFFRRFIYGKFVRWSGAAAVAVAALLFAAVHLPAYGPAAFPVDLGAGLLFGWQRWAAGTWTVPAATHMLANLLGVRR